MQCGSVILGHLLACFVNDGLTARVLYCTGLEVIRCENVQKHLCILVSAVWKNGDKQICIQTLAGICTYNPCCLPGPVYLHGFSGPVLQTHGCFCLVNTVRIILVELGGFIRKLAVLPALLTILHPQQTQCDATVLHLTVYPLIVRHFIHWDTLLCGKERCGDLLG